ncbi:MAG: type IV secretion system DNA-binding domain-containing protein [Gemmatimonadaceae bacterium]
MTNDVVLGTKKGTTTAVTLDRRSRSTHLHVVGASNSGKSNLLEHMIRQDIKAGRGLCLIDPHGTLYGRLVSWCALNEINTWRKIHLFEPSATQWAFGFNPIQFGSDRRTMDFSVDAVVNVFAQVWGSADMNQTPLLKRCLKLTLYALASNNLTLLEARDFTASGDIEGLRRKLTGALGDAVLQGEWDELNALPERRFSEVFFSTNNRMFSFLASEVVSTMVGQQQHVLDVGSLMANSETMLVDLSSGTQAFSRENAQLVGSLLVNDLLLKARSRPVGAKPFYLYIDECYRYLNDDIEDILFEMRKFGLHLVLAHQDLSQLRRRGESLYSAVMGGAQTKVVFRVGGMEDATTLATDLTAGAVNYEEAKKSFISYQTTGHSVTWLENEAQNRSSTSSTQINDVEGGGETTAESSPEDGDADDVRRTTTSSTNASRSTVTANSDTVADTRGRSQALQPDIVATNQQGYALPEIIHREAGKLTKQAIGEAVVKTPGGESVSVIVPRIRDLGNSEEMQEMIAAFKETVLSESTFTSPITQARQEIAVRQRRIRGEEVSPGKNPDDFLY